MPSGPTTRLFLAELAVILALTTACGPSRFDGATLALMDVRVITMRSETVVENQMVVIAGERILAVERSDPRQLPPRIPRVDGAGAYVLPGLTDMHVHVLSSSDDALERAFPLLVANGITTIRDMGSQLSALVDVRRLMSADPGVVAPRLFAAGPLLDGTRKPWYGDLPLILETPGDARQHLPRLREAGVDFFKVYDDLDSRTYGAIADEAASHGVHFVGHVPSGVPVADAARAGQRTIEHLGVSTVKDCVEDPHGWFQRSIEAKFQQGYDAYYRVLVDHWDSVDWSKCAASFEAMTRAGVYLTPTLDMELNDRGRLDADAVRYMLPQSRNWCGKVLSGIDRADAALREAAFGRQLDALQRIRSAGVTLLAGSDTPNNCVVEGFGLHWELALFVEAGLTPFEALQAATVDAARALDRKDAAGFVEANQIADLVLLERNPLDEITNTRKISGVVLRGRWLDRAALDELMAGALAAAGEAPSD